MALIETFDKSLWHRSHSSIDSRYDRQFTTLPNSPNYMFKVLVVFHLLLFFSSDPGIEWPGYVYYQV